MALNANASVSVLHSDTSSNIDSQVTLQNDTIDNQDVFQDSCEEDNLSEEQLRQSYDNDEIDRFLHLFSAVRPSPPVDSLANCML
jgi:hypothetical protein